ncbi:hypothetical protein D3C86_1665850 [compost metagenome]
MVAAAVADLEAERGNLGALVRPVRQIDAGGAGLAFGCEIIRRQRVQHRLLDIGHQLAHHQVAAAQVQQQVGHDLARPVISDLSATIDLDDGNRGIGREQVRGVPGLAERVDRRVLDQPDLVRRVGRAGLGIGAHGVETGRVRLQTPLDDLNGMHARECNEKGRHAPAPGGRPRSWRGLAFGLPARPRRPDQPQFRRP